MLVQKTLADERHGENGAGIVFFSVIKKPNEDRIIFLYAFAKNTRSNISVKEQEALSLVAESFISTTDVLCLPPLQPFKPQDMKRIREQNHASQAVFATIRGIGKTTVQQWEMGIKKPGGAARRLFDLIDRKGLSFLG